MSALTNALDRIRNWLQHNIPESVARLPPGLTPGEIQEIAKDLPFTLPREICELYQWSRGYKSNELDSDPFIFNQFALLSLEEAINIYREKLKRLKDYYQYGGFPKDNPSRFQVFFCIFGEIEGYVVIDSNLENCEVILSYWDSDERIGHYSSLTSMMLTLAESFERGNSPCMLEEAEFEEIWLGYNCDLLERKIVAVENNPSSKSVAELGGILSFISLSNANLIKSLIYQKRIVAALIIYLRNVPFAEMVDLNFLYGLVGIVANINIMKNMPGLELLVSALEDEYWLVRYWAALTLGDLEDARSIGPLKDALENGNRQMREQAFVTLSLMKKSIDSSENNYDWQFLTEAMENWETGYN